MRNFSFVLMIGLVVSIFSSSANAGEQQYYSSNAGIGAVTGCVVIGGLAAAIAGLTNGNAGKAGGLGCLAGGAISATNSSSGGGYGDTCSRRYASAGERSACQKGMAQSNSSLQKSRERSAYNYGRRHY